ncbi:unnamed protein product [Rotaria sordida]|uniref:Protein kinase domain-containing protein n=1 Tax=Rotaria sordida TaxID=392033 RepID=A0A815Z6F2_9BILA|nr:unnamed protein product [Rotaria sordida]CAF1578755.1 unnamed protein product [Rotaria sordida]
MKLEGIRNVSQLQIDSDISTNVPLMEEEAVKSDQQFWTIMKYIPGVTLREFVMSRLKQDGTISLLAAIKLAQQLLLIVKQIHLRGIVHRDLKHLNLMVDEQKGCPAEDARIYVVDFGLAYIETEEEIDWSNFDDYKKNCPKTNLGEPIGNAYYRVPQLEAKNWNKLSDFEKYNLLFDRRSPTIDTSNVCSILFWLITNNEDIKQRDDDDNKNYSWSASGSSQWVDEEQVLTERKHYDVLVYSYMNQTWSMILICKIHINENGQIVTLSICSTVNGLFLQLPLGQFSTVEVHQIDICADFTREIKTLLQLIKQQKEKYALEADTSPVADTSRASAANAPRRVSRTRHN